MLRRGEYVSYQYDVRSLLSAAMAGGQPLAYVNMALLEASHHNMAAAAATNGAAMEEPDFLS